MSACTWYLDILVRIIWQGRGNPIIFLRNRNKQVRRVNVILLAYNFVPVEFVVESFLVRTMFENNSNDNF